MKNTLFRIPQIISFLWLVRNIRAEYEDILIVCLHEISLTGYLAKNLRSLAHFLQQAGIPLQLSIIFIDFRTQTRYLYLITDMLTDAIVVDNANHQYAHHNHYQILVVSQIIQ